MILYEKLVSKFGILSLFLMLVVTPNLSASEVSDYEQYEAQKMNEISNSETEQAPIQSAVTGTEGETKYDDEAVSVDTDNLNSISYATYHEGYWYKPFYDDNSTGDGILLPEYLSYDSETIETIGGTDYYTYNYVGENVNAKIIIHLEGNELIFDVNFNNQSSSSKDVSTSVDFDTCISEVDDPSELDCDEDYVPLYSQGNQNGIYLNSEDYDIHFYINYLGDIAPDYSRAYPWSYGLLGINNQINASEDQLLLADRDTAVNFGWDRTLDAGESVDFIFSVGIGQGVYVPINRPTINALDNASTVEETTLSDTELMTLFAVSADDVEDGDLTSNVTVDQSSVDYSTPGTYSVSFKVVDSGGASTTYISELEVTDILPTIMTDEESVTVELGQELTDAIASYGATATEITEGDLTPQITVNTDSVDYTKAGSYDVILTVSDEEGNSTEKIVTLVIEDDPISVITGSNEQSTPEETILSDEELIALFEVTNDKDLVITVDQSQVDYSTPGDYLVTFTAEDGSNYTATLTIVDILPIITTDVNSVTIGVGSSLEDIAKELNATATEIKDGDLTELITIDDSLIDYNTAGTYQLVLTVSDQEGNVATTEVEIIVEDTFTQMVNDINNLATTGSTIVKTLISLLILAIILLVIKKIINRK